MEMASWDSKRGELKGFLKLFRDFKDFEPASDDTKKLKSKIMNKTHQLHNINTSILTKKNTIAKI